MSVNLSRPYRVIAIVIIVGVAFSTLAWSGGHHSGPTAQPGTDTIPSHHPGEDRKTSKPRHNKTPEGRYIINARNPNSGYHKNLGVSYPNETDKVNAEKLGKPAGGDIKIHGLRNGRGYIGKFHHLKDWTAGCIAVTNDEVDELYAAVKPNAVIEIRP